MVLGFVAVAAMGAACSGENRRTESRDSVAAKRTPRTTGPPSIGRPEAIWDTAAGNMFAIPGESPGEAVIIDPSFGAGQTLDSGSVDMARFAHRDLDVLTGRDSAQTARITQVFRDTMSACASWPRARLQFPGSVPQSWSIGFPRGRAAALPFDSLPTMARADSSRLTIAIALVASRLEGDTVPAFRGRPYIVRQVNRFRLPDGTLAVLADINRAVTQEANPLQEELLLLLEADRAGPGSPLRVAYSERQVGYEEALAAVELTSAVKLTDGTVLLILRREVGDGYRYEALERIVSRRWILRWRSAYAGC
jgi:hypothetical protein